MGWIEFCEDYNIDYKWGSNHENIEVQCPFCGYQDEGKHMGLSIDDSKYGCWRDEEHRGIAPARVVREMLDISWDEAKDLCNQYFNWNYNNKPKPKRALVSFTPPEAFLKFDGTDPMEKQFVRYLEKRGYSVNQLSRRYDIRWCYYGRYAYRVIIPIRLENEWYTWVARIIREGTGQQKYMTPSYDKDKVAGVTTDFLFDYDNLKGGDILMVCEGAFDAMKIQSAYIPGVSATCLFGQILSNKQLIQLTQVAPRYKKVILALDKDAYKHVLSIKKKAEWYLPGLGYLPPSKKDWGEMSADEIKKDIMTCRQ